MTQPDPFRASTLKKPMDFVQCVAMDAMDTKSPVPPTCISSCCRQRWPRREKHQQKPGTPKSSLKSTTSRRKQHYSYWKSFFQNLLLSLVLYNRYYQYRIRMRQEIGFAASQRFAHQRDTTGTTRNQHGDHSDINRALDTTRHICSVVIPMVSLEKHGCHFWKGMMNHCSGMVDLSMAKCNK